MIMTQEEIERLQEQHEEDELQMEYLQAENKFYKEFIEYNPEMITQDLEVMELIDRMI